MGPLLRITQWLQNQSSLLCSGPQLSSPLPFLFCFTGCCLYCLPSVSISLNNSAVPRLLQSGLAILLQIAIQCTDSYSWASICGSNRKWRREIHPASSCSRGTGTEREDRWAARPADFLLDAYCHSLGFLQFCLHGYAPPITSQERNASSHSYWNSSYPRES